MTSGQLTITNSICGGLGIAIFRALCAFSSPITADNVKARKTAQLILKMDLIAQFLNVAVMQMGNNFYIHGE